MIDIEKLKLLLSLIHSEAIARRYFVTNGFDGALAMVGLCMGISASGEIVPIVAAKACVGTGIALGVSGVTSAYISEAAERKLLLHELEAAMLKNLDNTTQSQTAKLMPLAIASVNGLAPLTIALLVSFPLWLAELRFWLPVDPLQSAIGIAMAVVFLLGVFLSRLSGTFWLWSGIKALGAAFLTLLLLTLL